MNRIKEMRSTDGRDTARGRRAKGRPAAAARHLVMAAVLAFGCAGAAGLPGTAYASDAAGAGADAAYIGTDAAYASAYLQVLQQNRDQILAYDWQDDWSEYMSGEDPDAVTARTLAPVSLVDICADETPELIFVAATSEYQAQLQIYSYTGGRAVQIFTRDVDWQAAGGYRYCLFQAQGSRDLWLFASYGDEIWTVTLESFELSGAQLTPSYLLFYEYGPNEDYSGTDEEYRENLTGISAEDYNAKFSAITNRMEHLYQLNYVDSDEMAEKAGLLEPESLSCAEAEELLRVLAGGGPDPAAGPGTSEKSAGSPGSSDLLRSVPDEFFFSSGAGAWGTEITLLDDGSFTGSFHDSNMGEDTEHYPGGVVYICEFSGHFSQFEQVDACTWRMYLDTLAYEYTDGEDWVSAEGIHYIPSEAYGIEDGEWFTLYLPGHDTRSLPEDFMMWARTYMNVRGNEAVPAQLTIYGLFNENNGNTFCAFPEDGSAAGADASAAGSGTGGSGGSAPTGQEGCLLPESSSRLVTQADIAGFTTAQIQTAVNEIYARHGYLFKTPEVLQYFNQFSWYNGVNGDMQSVYDSMSDIEKKNVNFLAGYL